jgi:hypothetical protein
LEAGTFDPGLRHEIPVAMPTSRYRSTVNERIGNFATTEDDQYR